MAKKKFLIATEGDVEAQVYAPVAAELTKRGCEVDIYSRYIDIEPVNVEYSKRGLILKPLEDLWGREEEYAFALVYREVQSALRYHQVPMGYVLFGPLSSEQRVIGAQFFMVDVIFVASENNKRNLRRSGYSGEIIVTGLPKYDELFKLPKSEEKLIVVPDTPNNPRGPRRKRYLELLVEIAKRHPDYQVVIKPRILLRDSWYNSDFLFGRDKHMEYLRRELEECPSNLLVLDEYSSMNELAARAALMISVPGSAIFPQLLLGKPGLFVMDSCGASDLVSDASYRCNLEIYEASGCGVWMDELLEHVPEGKLARSKWIDEEIGSFDGRAAGVIADYMIEAAQRVCSKIYWIPRLDCTRDDFSRRLQEFEKQIEDSNEGDVEKLHRDWLRNTVERGIEALLAIAEDLAGDIDLRSEMALLGETADNVFSLGLSGDDLDKAIYPVLIAIGELADAVWSVRQNAGYFRWSFRSRVESSADEVGFRLAEIESSLAERWKEKSRNSFGYTALDDLLEGPSGKHAETSAKIALQLFKKKCPRLAFPFAVRALEGGVLLPEPWRKEILLRFGAPLKVPNSS